MPTIFWQDTGTITHPQMDALNEGSESGTSPPVIQILRF
jgi:hypothetical protein